MKKIQKFFSDLIDSLNNKANQGFSGRKLTALFAVMMGAYITKYKLQPSDQLHALYAWLIIALLCLGIVTVEQIIKFKNGSPNETPTNNTTTSDNAS